MKDAKDRPQIVKCGRFSMPESAEEQAMNSVIYIVGLVVVVIAVLSFFGLR